MFAVTSPVPGVLEVNYMWLPTWIGLNSGLLQELGSAVTKSVVGLPLHEAEEIGHAAVVAFLTQKYPEIVGLTEYLNALKLVGINVKETVEER